MNDFELHYLHHSRSADFIEQAENERKARRILKDAKRTRSEAARRTGTAAHVGRAERPGLAARVAGALHRQGESGTDRAQSAK